MLSRRRFLTVAAAAAVAPRIDVVREPPRSFDVAVVGAGLSGLVAAHRLRQWSAQGDIPGDCAVGVFEGASRIGGRVHDVRLSTGHPVSLGAQWIGPGQTRILELAKELDLRTAPTFVPGRTVLRLGGVRTPTGGRAASRPATASGPASRGARGARAKIEALAATVDPAAPWNTPDARTLDATTFGAWLNENAGPFERDDVRTAFAAFLGDPDRTSLLHAAAYVRWAGGTCAALEHDAQTLRFVEGPGALIARLSESTRIFGQDVVGEEGVRVVRIDPDRGGKVRLEGAKVVGVLAEANRIVFAASPAAAHGIEFEPPLPAARRELQRRWAGTAGRKVQVSYGRPFWRESLLSGEAVDDGGPLEYVVDGSPPDGSIGVLTGFVSAEAESLLTLQGRIVEQLVALFGKEAAEPRGLVAYDWSTDRLLRGCVPTLPPGVWTSCGSALREPVGPIHWAGTETADSWMGYMEGAVVAGERAAREVLDALRRGRGR
jgi:monoamine oxidase